MKQDIKDQIIQIIEKKINVLNDDSRQLYHSDMEYLIHENTRVAQIEILEELIKDINYWTSEV